MDISTKRIKYIDIAKCIAMLLVIHNHWLLDYDNNDIKIYIASFHMPLFFILSGLTTKIPDSIESIKLHILKRIKTIMLPFYLWSFIYTGFQIKKIVYIFWGSNSSIGIAGGIGGSWFLPCFFVADILACVALYICRKKIKMISVLAVLFFAIAWGLNKINISIGFPFNMDVAFAGAGFICLGILAEKNNVFKKLNEKTFIQKIVLMILLLAATGFFAFINTKAYDNLYRRLVMALGYYGNYFIFVLGGISGTILIIVISMLLQKTKISGWIQKIGMNTFTILLLQQFFIIYFEKIIKKTGIGLNFIYPIIFSVICLVLCHYAGRIITGIFPNLKGSGVIPEYEKQIEKRFIKH